MPEPSSASMPEPSSGSMLEPSSASMLEPSMSYELLGPVSRATANGRKHGDSLNTVFVSFLRSNELFLSKKTAWLPGANPRLQQTRPVYTCSAQDLKLKPILDYKA